RGRLQNVLRGAVVLLQANDARLRKVLLKLQNVANVGAAPGVNALVFVAYGAYIVFAGGEHAHQFVLRAVGVLVLVHLDVAIAAIVTITRLAGGFQHAPGIQQQVVKVEGSGLRQLLLIDLVNVGHALGLGVPRLQVNLLRIEHVILGPRYAPQNVARRQLFVIDAQTAHGGLHDVLLVGLVIDDEIFAITFAADLQRVDVATEQAHAKRMEGGDQRLGERAAAHQRLHPAGHFGSGLVGESDRQNGVGRHAHTVNQVGDAIGDNARFAAARSREDQHRPVDRLDGFALLRIQVVEIRRQCRERSKLVRFAAADGSIHGAVRLAFRAGTMLAQKLP